MTRRCSRGQPVDRLTPEQIEILRAMALKPETQSKIVRTLGVSHYCVRYWLKREGLPSLTRHEGHMLGIQGRKKDWRKVFPTDEQLELIKEMATEPCTQIEIGERFGIPRSRTRFWLELAGAPTLTRAQGSSLSKKKGLHRTRVVFSKKIGKEVTVNKKNGMKWISWIQGG